MIKNYFKIAWRNLFKNKIISLINIGGLAVGMAVAMIIGLWVHDELTFNKNHKNYEQIAQVMMNKTSGGGEISTQEVLPYPLGDELRKSYGDKFKYVVMSSYVGGNNILSVGEKSISKSGSFMEPDVLRMLSLNMINGNWDGLKDPNSVVISQSTSKALFDDKNPIGEFLKIDNQLNVQVTGVYEDLPHNAKFNALQFIAPWELYVIRNEWVKNARDNSLWDNNSYQLYVQIADKTTMQQISKTIANTVQNNVPEYSKRSNPKIFLHPMKDWHLRSDWKNGVKTGGFIQYVWLFGIIGVFVLLLACINFMNLSTAQSEKKAKEVGIRKTIGSSKNQLIYQFLSESFLVVMFSFMLTLLIVFLSIPSFNQLTNKQIILPFTNIYFWLESVGFVLITSIIAGSYPALYLSSFIPIKALKGTFKIGKSVALFRKTLVVVQFTISVILIIGTLMVKRQIDHSKNRPIGYQKDRLIMIEKLTEDYEGKYNILRNELINSGSVVEMAESSSPLTDVWSSGGGFEWEGKDPGLITNFVTVCLSHDYGKTIGWNIIQGRDFSRDFATDSTAFVLNEAAVKYMGLDNPIGKIIRSNGQDHKVIGVVKDILVESPFAPVKQAIYMIKYDNTNWIELKLHPEKSISEALAAIKIVFNKHIPNVPFEYQFVDSEFGNKFLAEQRIRKLSTIFSILAIFISCLGLFALASFMAEQRNKEVGIRKVVGASVFDLWKLLSKDFVKLVLISCFIAIPISYYAVANWLNNYEYRTDISWWVFLLASTGAIIITIITISFQSIKVATANPIKSLRTE